MASSASLDALPNELLYEILRYLTRERDGATPRRYRMITTFASINRRLRQFALMHVFREIRVPNYDRLPAMFAVFNQHLSRINSISVGYSPLPKLSLFGAGALNDGLLPSAFDFVRLQNLVDFDCLGFCFEPRELTEVFGVSNPTLRSLRLSWAGSCAFPFHAFPSLENLFIRAIPRTFVDFDVPCLRIFPSLTTFLILDTDMWFETEICGCMTFPHLRAFYMVPDYSNCDTRILDFISDHPTLLDVNIPKMYIDFPDFIQLVKGGRNIKWHTPSESFLEEDSSSVESLRLAPTYDPEFAKWNDSKLSGFAFVRASRKQPENTADPLPPHKLTELSIVTSSAMGNFRLADLGELGRLSLFADCTRLSIILVDPLDGGDTDPELNTVESIIAVLQDSLPKWEHLRHFYLGCRFPFLWDDIFDGNGLLPMRGGKPFDLKTYCDTFGFSTEKIQKIQQNVIDLGFECSDDTCIMQLWEAMYEEEMAGCVRSLAWACMTLEVFEWSMRDPGFDAGDLIRGCCAPPPLWRWDIHRNPLNGGVRLVSGHATWNGHPNHLPSSLGEQFRKYKN
ncbi:hypothetical protein C8R44DRAFT_316628 [Mycena epipterygia]|nr:hypothetical protein C8R44DRAFT_316628 [Mycena epipterygia]